MIKKMVDLVNKITRYLIEDTGYKLHFMTLLTIADNHELAQFVCCMMTSCTPVMLSNESIISQLYSLSFQQVFFVLS